MKDIFILTKQEGETPLECLDRFKQSHKKYAAVPLTYAGRLDPMASGKLVILAGPKTKEKEQYLSLEKEYTFEILLGVSTDTGDVLGMVTEMTEVEYTPALVRKLMAAVQEYQGKTFEQKYPLFSSKTVHGQPLFMYARKNEILSAIEHPTKLVTIITLTCTGSKTVKPKALLKDIGKRIAKVKGDFRQKDILARWQSKLSPDPKNCSKSSFEQFTQFCAISDIAQMPFIILKCKAKVTSGTYIRTLAENIGKAIGLPALAYSIKRTKIGKF